MNARLQLDLRQAVNDKISQGFEVVSRDNGILMQRGTQKIQVIIRNLGAVVIAA